MKLKYNTIRKCSYCNEPARHYNGQENAFCCKEHLDLFHAEGVPVRCHACGSTRAANGQKLTSRNVVGMFCSTECVTSYANYWIEFEATMLEKWREVNTKRPSLLLVS